MTSWWTPQAAILVLFIVVVQWSAICVQASSIFCDDSELCLSKRFLRFGRALSADPYYKINGQFYRLNRGYPPYQDKRFLRFGRSQFQGLEDIYGDIPEPYSRKRRSLDTDSQLEVTHDHVRRSADQSTIENPEKDDMSKTIKKRAIDEGVASGVMSKRFMRFGRDFSSNGGGSFGDDNNDIDNNNNDNSQYDKRFMRFGKRPMAVKRFMRFGRNHGMDTGSDILVPLPQNSKRFMRFGKRKNDLGDEIDAENDDISSVLEEEEAKINKLSNVLSLAHRLQSKSGELGGGGGSLYGTQKRFMRFGKRSGSLEGLAKGS